MGLIDYLLEKTLKVSPDQLYRHECAECDALVGDMLPSLPPGTPVFCHFTLNVAEHSGICIGDKIVHLDGSGEIISSTPQEFLARLDGRNLAANIYYAAIGRNKALSGEDIASRALAAVGEHRKYNLLMDNCHGFTVRCVTGIADCSAAWSIREIEYAITKAFGTDSWRWRCWDGWKKQEKDK